MIISLEVVMLLFHTVIKKNYKQHSIRYMVRSFGINRPKFIRDVSNLSSFNAHCACLALCLASTYRASFDILVMLQKRAVRVITKSAFIADTLPLFQQMKI